VETKVSKSVQLKVTATFIEHWVKQR